MASNFKLSDTLNYILPQVNFYPLALGSSQQPFMGFCTCVAQILMTPPFKPNFNRSEYNFNSNPNIQTYAPCSNWTASTPFTAGTVIFDSNGNGQKCLVGGTSGSVAPIWQIIFALVVSDNGISWQCIGPLETIAQISDLSYIESAAVQDVLNNNQWKELGIKLDLSRDSQPGCPKYICALTDDNLGNIAFRVTPMPAASYPISIQYQRVQVPFQTLGSTWAPLPDRLFYTYSTGVAALCFLYKGDTTRFQLANQMFISMVLSYYEGLSESEINQFLVKWQGMQAALVGTRAQQGTVVRGSQ